MSGKPSGDSFDFYSLTLQENEWRMNRIMGSVAIACVGFMAFCYFLTLLGVFTLRSSKMLFLVLVPAPFAAVSFLVGTVYKVKRPWVKYCLMAYFWLDVILLFSNLTMHVTLILCVPVLLALLYSSRRFFFITALVGVGAIFLAHCLCLTYSIVNDPLVTSYYRSIVFGFIPRIMEYGLVCIIAAFVARNNSTMMNKGYYYVNRTAELLKLQRSSHYETVKNLATITENKSLETGEHISRVFDYMMVFTHHMGLPEEEAYDVSLAAMLHDIGKLRIPDEILNKPGRLTPEEYSVIKEHAPDGKALLSHTGNTVLEMASVIAEQHHERWDGKGYLGLKGEQIDTYSQLMSVIDVFDALTSLRCYKPPWPVDEAYDEIVRNRGTQFSPMAVDLFKECFDEFLKIYHEKCPDAETAAAQSNAEPVLAER